MPVKKDASGRRYVEVSVEVPGSPEEVWKAIATGPGISSWFVPTEGEERVGGSFLAHFAPGNSMDSVSQVTKWEPPRRFVAESENMGPDAPKVATEWIVEARKGGTCTVRVVHSWFAQSDDWDSQFEGHEMGWPIFFRVLQLYLTHFRGQPCSAFQLMGMDAGPATKSWDTLTSGLGLAGAKIGQKVKTAAGAPRLAGTVDQVAPVEYPGLIIKLDEPAPGIAHLFVLPMGQVFVPVRLYLYGEQSAAIASREESVWQQFMAERFAPPG